VSSEFEHRPDTPLEQPPPGPPVWRRLFHLTAGSVVPVAGIFLAWPAIVALAGALATVSLLLDLLRLRWSELNRRFLRLLQPLLKTSEDRRITGATYMLVASFVAFLFLDQMVAVAALLFLSLGDPAAALVGQRAPGPRFRGKSPLGTATFVAVGLLVVGALVGGGFIQYHWGLLAGAALAGLVELAPLPVDDNLSIPLVSGALMQLLVTA
jgi:acyl phosphate:glycerol-3-phosphate acyltransferase